MYKRISNRKLPPRRDVAERFWEKVDKSEGFGRWGTCWQWKGSVNWDKRGSFHLNGVTKSAPIVSWILSFGSIPPHGLCVLHRCDNPTCVNPDHLFLGTQQDNLRDCIDKQRNAVGERNGLSRLSERQVAFIRQVISAGASRSKVSRLFGLNRENVRAIAIRKTWRHVA